MRPPQTLDLSVARQRRPRRSDQGRGFYATDGNGGTSSTVNDTVTVANTAPVAGTVSITPGSPKTNQTLTATPAEVRRRRDDRLAHLPLPVEFDNGSPLAGETAENLDLSVLGNGDRGDLIKVEVYATDGNGGTDWTVNDTVTVANAAPVADDDDRSTDEDTPLSGASVLANDSDDDSDALRLSLYRVRPLQTHSLLILTARSTTCRRRTSTAPTRSPTRQVTEPTSRTLRPSRSP